MTFKKELELFLYKNKLNNKTIIDLIQNLSSKTVNSLLFDLKSNFGEKQSDDSLNKIFIFTDGGCINNGRKNAKAAFSVHFTEDQDSPFYKFNTTEMIKDPSNNKAELSGIKKVFAILFSNINLFKNNEIFICTDSMYSIKCIDTWSKNWVKNNWKNAKGEPVKNKEIIMDILNYKKDIEKENIEINFKHIFSHTKCPQEQDSLQYFLWKGNDIVDKNIILFLKDDQF